MAGNVITLLKSENRRLSTYAQHTSRIDAVYEAWRGLSRRW